MADIALVFHWELDRLGAMDPVELARWREMARRRSEQKRR